MLLNFLFRFRLLYIRLYLFLLSLFMGSFSRALLFYAFVRLLLVFLVFCLYVVFFFAFDSNELIEYLGTGSMNFKSQISPVYKSVLPDSGIQDSLLFSEDTLSTRFKDYRFRQNNLYYEYLAKRTIWRQRSVPNSYKIPEFVLDLSTFTPPDQSASAAPPVAPDVIHIYGRAPHHFKKYHYHDIWDLLTPRHRRKFRFFGPQWDPLFETIGWKTISEFVRCAPSEYYARCLYYNSVVEIYRSAFFDYASSRPSLSPDFIEFNAEEVPRVPTIHDPDFTTHFRYFYDESAYLSAPTRRSTRFPPEHPIFGSLGYEGFDTTFAYYVNNYSRGIKTKFPAEVTFD